MVKDILGIFLLPVAVVAVLLMAMMVDSPIMWVHVLGIILVVGTIAFCSFMLAIMISVFREH